MMISWIQFAVIMTRYNDHYLCTFAVFMRYYERELRQTFLTYAIINNFLMNVKLIANFCVIISRSVDDPISPRYVQRRFLCTSTWPRCLSRRQPDRVDRERVERRCSFALLIRDSRCTSPSQRGATPRRKQFAFRRIASRRRLLIWDSKVHGLPVGV